MYWMPLKIIKRGIVSPNPKVLSVETKLLKLVRNVTVVTMKWSVKISAVIRGLSVTRTDN